MTQSERRKYLIERLLDEQPRYGDPDIPNDADAQKRMLRSLMNVRPASPMDDEFLAVQDEYLREDLMLKGVTDLADLTPIADNIYLWQGDITTLRCDAIVNAANSGMTGCYIPCHACIDNAIHTCAGVQLRLECAQLMERQGHPEEIGKAKITPAYNLPCKYVLHTVGPIVTGALRPRDEEILASCYRSCLELAEKNGVGSVAFCCISTGEFCFPNERAAEIAIQTVHEFLTQNNSDMKVIFNVFKDVDYEIYRELLGAD